MYETLIIARYDAAKKSLSLAKKSVQNILSSALAYKELTCDDAIF